MKLVKWRWPALFCIVMLALCGYWLIQVWLGPQVVGIPVVKEELIQTVLASGKVELPPSVEISSKLSGKVTDVKVVAGDFVSVGQILLTLENKVDRGAIKKAGAVTAQADARFRKISEQTQAGSEHSIQLAKTSLHNRKKQYARTRELAAKGYVSQDQASDALRNLTVAQSQLATAEFQAKANRAKGSEYALAEIALNKARANERAARDRTGTLEIASESAGVMISCKVERGDMVLPGKILMAISPAGKARLLVQLDEKNIRDIKLGQKATVAADGHPDLRFYATLSYINSAIDTARGIVELTFDAINPPGYLLQDMAVSLAIEVSRRRDALTVPATSIRNAEGTEPWVMVVDNGRSQRRTVRLGVREKNKIEIIEGLREGDFVLPATGFEIEEGKRLRLARADSIS